MRPNIMFLNIGGPVQLHYYLLRATSIKHQLIYK